MRDLAMKLIEELEKLVPKEQQKLVVPGDCKVSSDDYDLESRAV